MEINFSGTSNTQKQSLQTSANHGLETA